MQHSAENDLPQPITVAPEDVVEVVLLGMTFEWFQRELRARGLYLFPIPSERESDLRAFGVGVGDALMGYVLPPGEGKPDA